jgi:hypothetical protein
LLCRFVYYNMHVKWARFGFPHHSSNSLSEPLSKAEPHLTNRVAEFQSPLHARVTADLVTSVCYQNESKKAHSNPDEVILDLY